MAQQDAEDSQTNHDDPDNCITDGTISRDTSVELPDSVFGDIIVSGECTVCGREFSDVYTYADTFAEDSR